MVAGEEGFEPSHAGIKIRCLNQLGDSPNVLTTNNVADGLASQHTTKPGVYRCFANQLLF